MAVIMIRVPDDWLPAVNAAATKQGVEQATFCREAIKAALPSRVAAKLSTPRGRGRHPKPERT